jgi:leucyl-tRNA synthetase
MESEFFNSIAEKWQTFWEENKVFQIDAGNDRSKKKFITVPFPYTNSPMHIGHGRTYISADVYARYLRMKGFNVLFPFAFQFTGTPILAVADAIKRGDIEMIESFSSLYNIPKEKIKEMEDPYRLAEYFKNEMEKTAKRLGLSIDWRRSFTTTQEEFQDFVQWQFRKLKKEGYLVSGSDVVGFCPSDNFPVGMHDTKGDVEPEIEDLDIIFFEGDNFMFPVATSRPETLFGSVAIAIGKDSYMIVEEEGKSTKRYVISKNAFYKISFQKKLKKIREISPEELESMNARNPITGKEIRIIKGKFVEPSFGTGLVMLVPAHDPFHLIMARDAGIQEVIPIISTPDLPEIPSIGIDTEDPAELKDYADSIYRTEFYKGVVRDDVTQMVPEFMRQKVKDYVAGRKVMDARRNIIELLRTVDRYDELYEIINGPIYCRCGAEIVVKRIENQWFLIYDDPKWKNDTLRALNHINFIPSEIRKDFERAIFNMRRRAIGRSRGIGVKLPWDESQIIDSLSDSTIYTAFYTISHLIRGKRISDEILDYVVLGKGNPLELAKESQISIEEIKRMREEFEYWYPVDSRHSGRDLVQNHLPFYIYNHLAIFGEEMLPRQIVLNGFIRVGGKKMSKSLRNIYPLEKAISEFGVDPVRVALTTSSQIIQDTDFEPKVVESVSEQLKKIFGLVSKMVELHGEAEIQSTADKWLSTLIRRRISEIDNYYAKMMFKDAFNLVIYTIYEDIKDYTEMGDQLNPTLLKKVASAWIRMMSPVVPHLAEELWSKGFQGLVSTQPFPTENEFNEYEETEFQVEYLKNLIESVREVENVISKEPEKIILYVDSDKERKEIVRRSLEFLNQGKGVRDFVMEVKGDETDLENIYRRMEQYDRKFRILLLKYLDTDEMKILADNVNFLIRKLNVTEISIFDSRDPMSPDVKGKKNTAVPFSPSVVII